MSLRLERLTRLDAIEEAIHKLRDGVQVAESAHAHSYYSRVFS